jgi:hypothetical protein
MVQQKGFGSGRHAGLFVRGGAVKTKQASIVVAGDGLVDWLEWASPDEGVRMAARPGGALLLARLVETACEASVAAPALSGLESLAPGKVAGSHVRLARFPASSSPGDAKNLVWRIKELRRYAGAEGGDTASMEVAGESSTADLVILDDAGSGFRDEPGAWPKTISEAGRHPLVLLKMSRPLATGPLFQELAKSHADRLVVVVDADDVRCQGANISRHLSWERTAKDFVWQLASNQALASLAECRHLVVRFGLDGAIYRRSDNGNVDAHLYYDPARIEGEYAEQRPGEMTGLGSAFTAALAARLANTGLEGVGDGVPEGLTAGRRLLAAGFGNIKGDPDWVPGALLDAELDRSVIADVAIPPKSSLTSSDPEFWTILKESTDERLEPVALNHVERGADPLLDRVPAGRFGQLKTIDRTEIEGYRSVKNLISEYLAAGCVKRPLCIGVFGPPGSGKTFSVTQIAKSVGEGTVQGISFNVAQWESPRDLASALHQVRDLVLEGKVPLVFFDEFDAAFEGAPLGWLKFFLDPMQDGRFKDGESTHPIGKSILIFAGATSYSLAEFARGSSGPEVVEQFRLLKGPDFVSRLRGYVDILGIDQRSEDDRLYMIRRAVALRGLLERGAAQLLDPAGRIRIDAGVLRALIKIPRYRHGMRSLESLIDMSMLAGRDTFEQSALPPASQLELHVDADAFMRLVARDTLVGAARENVAQAIHQAFIEDNKSTKAEEDPGMQPWEDLSEDYRKPNLEQADWYRAYLEAVDCGFVPTKADKPNQVKFTPAEVEKLAQMEHERWCAEKRSSGYVFGPSKNDETKAHPCMVPWDQLSEEEKEKDRQVVRALPQRMAAAGFETYRLGRNRP